MKLMILTWHYKVISMTNRREFIKLGIAALGGAAVASAIEIPTYTSQIQQKDQQINQLQSEIDKLSQGIGFLTLNPKEQMIDEAMAETMIPTDENGSGAREARVIYFIDRMLAGNYGKSGNMYLQGPWRSSVQG